MAASHGVICTPVASVDPADYFWGPMKPQQQHQQLGQLMLLTAWLSGGVGAAHAGAVVPFPMLACGVPPVVHKASQPAAKTGRSSGSKCKDAAASRAIRAGKRTRGVSEVDAQDPIGLLDVDIHELFSEGTEQPETSDSQQWLSSDGSAASSAGLSLFGAAPHQQQPSSARSTGHTSSGGLGRDAPGAHAAHTPHGCHQSAHASAAHTSSRESECVGSPTDDADGSATCLEIADSLHELLAGGDNGLGCGWSELDLFAM
ncbi:hypothetical protein FOA52_007850 [Chlamydomonas sp. UWO 241]|nr:hypothetical protein FOA52_007850 [Chlamydomonas sp. UWO 241]